MGVIDDLLEHNRRWSEGRGQSGADARPRRALAIVTCMDCRLDVLGALGLELGEAHVLRNAGGAVTDDTIRSLAISQRKLGTRSVMLIHHTRCGMATLNEEEFAAELQQAAGVAPRFAIEAFGDVQADVRESMQRVRRSPFLPHRDDVRGFVYDVDSGRVCEVAAGPG